MVASARVQSLNNKSDEITVLLEFLNNPNLASDLAAEVKKLNSLTAEQEAQLHEAKILVQSKDSLVKEIEGKKLELASLLDEHNKKVSSDLGAFNKHVSDQTAALEKARADLDARKVEHDERETKLRQQENKLKETAAKIKGLAGE